MVKSSKFFALILLTSLLLLTTLNCTILLVKSQGDATVVVFETIGGTISPSGTNTYADASTVTLTATPNAAFVFINWVVSTDSGSNALSDNPLKITVEGGVTYDVIANFQPIEPANLAGTMPDLSTAAIVVVLVSGGGTTEPKPGTYALENATSFNLTAIPDSGWRFTNWVISGANIDHGTSPLNLTPSDNPYNVNHGYGNTYAYQAVFVPVSSATPTPSASPSETPSSGTSGGMSNETWIIIGLVIVIVALLIAFGTYVLRQKK